MDIIHMKQVQRTLSVLLLSVLVVPETNGDVYIRHGPKHQRVRAGMAVTYRCTAGTDTLLDGVPQIEWRKDDERINYGRDFRFRKDSVENTLTIQNASTQDTGLYTCVAKLSKDRDTASAQLIVEDVPDPPIHVKLTSCDNRVAQLSWRLISENYSPVLQYIIQYNTSFNPAVWQDAKTQLPRDRFFQRITLSPYANYSFRVIAENQIGRSKPSLPTDNMCHMPPDVPHHNPGGVCTLNVRPKTLVITWQLMSQEEQNAPGFYYLIKWRRHDLPEDEFQEKDIRESINVLTIEGEPIYKEYEIYVLSINEVGEAVSPPRMVIGFSGEDVPKETPQNFGLNPEKDVTATTADFIWDAVNTGPWRMQGFFRGYKIQYWKTSEGQRTMGEHSIIFREAGPCWRVNPRQKRDTSSGHVYNLWSYTNITAQIRALNAKYEGPPSKPITFLTGQGVPGPVRTFYLDGKGPTYFMLAWDRPAVVNGVLIGYIIAFKVIDSYEPNTKREVEVNDDRATEFRLDGLVPETMYRMSIWALTNMGRGDEYQIEEKTLPAGAPVLPNFTTVNISKRAVNITWFPSIPGNPGTVFTVEYRTRGELQWQKSAEMRERRWMVLEGLSPDKVYEVRVVARNGDDPKSPETSSPLQSIQIGRKRELSQPVFRVLYVTDDAFAIGLSSFNPGADRFYAQYRPIGSYFWHYSDDTPIKEWARVDDLEPDTTYEVRVVTKSAQGDATSLMKHVTAGMNPDAQASISKGQNSAVFWGQPVTFLLPIATVSVSLLTSHILTNSHLQLSDLFSRSGPTSIFHLFT